MSVPDKDDLVVPISDLTEPGDLYARIRQSIRHEARYADGSPVLTDEG